MHASEYAKICLGVKKYRETRSISSGVTAPVEDLQRFRDHWGTVNKARITPANYSYSAMSDTSSSAGSSPGRNITQDTSENDMLRMKSLQTRPSSLPQKPELKFSIERILGLNKESSSSSSSSSLSIKRENCFDDRFNVDGDDDDDNDEDDNECIDVDDTKGPAERLRDRDHDKNFSLYHDDETPQYQWLQCTRYHPPKLQRNKKKDGAKKRKLGRNPRVPFSQHQVIVLEEKFRRTHYLSSMDVAELSTTLNLTETRVKIWFQNRRARERRDKEASQRNQAPMVQKSFQPLTIPTVTWPMPASLASATYVQYQNALDFGSSYLSSAFGMYTSSKHGGDGAREVNTSGNNNMCGNKAGILNVKSSPDEQM